MTFEKMVKKLAKKYNKPMNIYEYFNQLRKDFHPVTCGKLKTE